MGRVISQRRTKEDWTLLLEMHRALSIRCTDTRSFRRGRSARRRRREAGSPPPDNRHPMDKAIAHLSTAFPLTTPEWAAWSGDDAAAATGRDAGRWPAISRVEGPVFGQVTITDSGRSPNGGEFTTEATLTYANGGQTITRRGRAIVYTGFQWRGRSSGDATAFRFPASPPTGAK